MRKYASKTSVPVGRTQDEIRRLVVARGATGWMVGEDNGQAVVSFRMLDRTLRFRMRLPSDQRQSKAASEAEERRLWRALCMAIKAKLVIAAEGIETFDEVFLSNIVCPDGGTVGDHVLEDVQAMIASGSTRSLRLLPAGDKR